MKRCSSCKKIKSLDGFNFKNKTKNKKHSQCKECSRLCVRSHYVRNKGYYLKKTRKRNHKIIGEIRSYLLKYFSSHPCADCGESNPVVLEFHHLSNKVSEISTLMRGRKFEDIKEEVKRCQVLCANCHRKKTAKANGWYKILPL